jgi:uncharacterized membrane protein YfcA
VLTLVFALLIGAVLGMLGGGGSILTVPVLTYVAGLDPKVAIASSLPVVAVTSAFGALGHWRAGQVQLRVAAIFGAFTMVGGFLGAQSARWISGQTQLLLFAAVMLAAAVSMLRPARVPILAPDAEPFVLPLSRLAPLGLGVGLLTGLVGVGGGFLIVPALVQLGHVPIRAAIGTSLLVIAMNASAGTLGYLGHVSLPLGILLPFTGLALVGIAFGTGAAQRVPQRALRRGFAVLLLLVAGTILYQNRAYLAETARLLIPPSNTSTTAFQPRPARIAPEV